MQNGHSRDMHQSELWKDSSIEVCCLLAATGFSKKRGKPAGVVSNVNPLLFAVDIKVKCSPTNLNASLLSLKRTQCLKSTALEDPYIMVNMQP